MSAFEEVQRPLPLSWKWTAIGEIADVIGGGTPDTTNRANFGGAIPWITPADMSNHVGKRIAAGARSLSMEGFESSAASWLPEGSVLFSSRAPIGYVAIASRPLSTNQGFKSFVPAAGINSEFLFYWLTTAKPIAERLASGTTFLEISGAKAALLPLPLAPIREQARIVEKLEEVLSDLDAGVQELKAAQKKLAKYRQSLLKAAVDGTLTASWREAQRQLEGKPEETGARLLERILVERRAQWEAKTRTSFNEQHKKLPERWREKYREPVRPTIEQGDAVPANWALGSIDQLARVGTGVTPLRSKSAYFVDGTIPWVTSGAVNSEIVNQASELVTEFAIQECRLQLFPAGTLLVAMYGEGKTRGKTSELAISATINQALAALVFERDAQPCKAFVKIVLQTGYERLREKASGGVQPNLNLDIVRSIVVPLPPLDEQFEIVRLLAEQFEQLDRQRAAVALGLDQAAAQRQNILKTAFSGRLVPQDPNDEPASVLLDRIRVDRAACAAGRPSSRRKSKVAA